jgi:phosphoribosyl-dephospho-CoA transferase
MERLTTGGAAPVHDLLRLRDPAALAEETPLPAWAVAALQRAPWVVVRRGWVREGLVPVGVRGELRSERFAAWLPPAAIVDRAALEELIASLDHVEQQRADAIPALAALARTAPLLAPHRWGPGGSIGFELATGVPTATPASDLDLVIRRERPLAPNEAAELWAALTAAAAPARVDVLLETPHGGVALVELLARPARVLLRTPDGPRLVADPWSADGAGPHTRDV